jgi:hypothetical protein
MIERVYFTIYIKLSYSPGYELSILRSKIEYYDLFLQVLLLLNYFSLWCKSDRKDNYSLLKFRNFPHFKTLAIDSRISFREYCSGFFDKD